MNFTRVDLLKQLQAQINYTFKNADLLRAALTHPSIKGSGKDFERLEFLGDRVLGLVIADLVYRNFHKEKEGDLAKRLSALVCKETCQEIANSLNLTDYLLVNQLELGSRSTVLSDGVEALLGAIYLDGGFAACRDFVIKHWSNLISRELTPPKDAKSTLQEWAQVKFQSTPRYELVEITGTAHEPTFKVKVSVGNLSFEEVGPSKRQAEQGAAKAFLLYLKVNREGNQGGKELDLPKKAVSVKKSTKKFASKSTSGC